jgi:hypothetical protein
MFITRDEKKYLFDQIKELTKDLSLASSEIIVLKGKLKAAEGNIIVLRQIVEFNKAEQQSQKPKKTMSAEHRKKLSDMMKARHQLIQNAKAKK